MNLDIAKRDMDDIDEALLDEELTNRFRRKLLALKMRSSGVPLEMIATSLKVTTRSVSHYLAEYREGGLQATMEDRAYCPMSSLEPFIDRLADSFDATPVGCTRQARRRILEITGLEMSPSQTRRIMKRLGMRYRKSGQIPCKADPDKQLEFLDEKLQPRLDEAAAGERKVFFVDAAHFVMGAVVGMLWCMSRVFVRGASGRKRYNVLGAVDSQSKRITTVTNDTYITAPTVCELLAKLHRENPGIPLTLVLDNARYQKCRLVTSRAAELGMEMLYLPAYSPNLNIIERLWKFIKKDSLSNAYHESFGEFTGAIDAKIKEANTTLRSQMKSLMSLNFQTLPTDANRIL